MDLNLCQDKKTQKLILTNIIHYVYKQILIIFRTERNNMDSKKDNPKLARQYLEDNNLKQSFFERVTGRSRTWVWKMLNGDVAMTVEDAINIEKATNGLLKVKNW